MAGRPDRSGWRALADNFIGYDDGFDTPGERLGRGANALALKLYKDPMGVVRNALGGAKKDLDNLMFEGGAMENPANVLAYAAAPMAPMSAPSNALRSGAFRTSGVPMPQARKPFIPDEGPLAYRNDPLGYQSTKTDRPMREVFVDQVDLGSNLPRQPTTIESLQGRAVLPIFWDKTSGQQSIRGIDEMTFDQPVTSEGGVDFLRGPAHQSDGSVLASHSNIMTRIKNRIDKVSEESGLPVSGLTISMAPDAADFTTFGGATMAEMVKQSKIPKKAASEFDKIMRGKYPDFPGTLSPDLRKWMENTTPDARKAFIRTAEKAPWQAAGFPSPGKMRYAVTDENQRWLPSGQAGQGIMNFPNGMDLVENPSVPHNTYGVQGRGEYGGTMETAPQTEIFRDFFTDPSVTMKNGKPVQASNQVYTQKLRLPYQKIDQEIVDRIMQMTERQR